MNRRSTKLGEYCDINTEVQCVRRLMPPELAELRRDMADSSAKMRAELVRRRNKA